MVEVLIHSYQQATTETATLACRKLEDWHRHYGGTQHLQQPGACKGGLVKAPLRHQILQVPLSDLHRGAKYIHRYSSRILIRRHKLYIMMVEEDEFIMYTASMHTATSCLHVQLQHAPERLPTASNDGAPVTRQAAGLSPVP